MRGVLFAVAMALSATGARAEAPQDRFNATMDRVFGAGNWRLTGGYRSPERENELRRQGALTVAPGRLSRHSVGRPGAPGAYDIVVNGMSPWQAAEKLRRAGAPFRRYSPKGRHGSQGPHLHLEPLFIDFRGASAPRDGQAWRVVDVTPAQQEAARLRAEALKGDALAQLHLGELYAEGLGVSKDLAAARYWMLLARASAGSDAEMAAEVETALLDLEPRMSREEMAHAKRHAAARLDCAASGCAPAAGAPRLAAARFGAAEIRAGTAPGDAVVSK